MTKIEKIGEEIKTLNHFELEVFRQWFQTFDAEAWDQQLDEDIRDGKLDPFAKEALEEYNAGRSREL